MFFSYKHIIPCDTIFQPLIFIYISLQLFGPNHDSGVNKRRYSYLPLLPLNRIIGIVIKYIKVMENFLGWKPIVIIMSLAFIIVACSSQDSSNPQHAVAATIDPANAGLVARVNGVAITEATFNRAFERRTTANIADVNALKYQMLNELIEQELINQGAPDLGIMITEVDVQAEIAAQREIAGSEETWQASLTQNNYTEEEWAEAQYDVLVTLAVRNYLLEPYLGEVEQVQAWHIVVASREDAEQVLERLSNGEDFAALASEVSIFESIRETQGYLGWFARKELVQSNLEDLAFSLEPGQIAGPISTSLGYHIIQTLDKAVRPIEPERLPTLSENTFNSWIAEQYRNANIEKYIQW
jgi:parvulin-like peptidyl-prolyl isomerase